MQLQIVQCPDVFKGNGEYFYFVDNTKIRYFIKARLKRNFSQFHFYRYFPDACHAEKAIILNVFYFSDNPAGQRLISIDKPDKRMRIQQKIHYI
jgi:hypothetical protein